MGYKLPSLTSTTSTDKKPDTKPAAPSGPKRVACPKPLVEQVMFFDDDKCTKIKAGQTAATLKSTGEKFTKEAAQMVEKC